MILARNLRILTVPIKLIFQFFAANEAEELEFQTSIFCGKQQIVEMYQQQNQNSIKPDFKAQILKHLNRSTKAIILLPQRITSSNLLNIFNLQLLISTEAIAKNEKISLQKVIFTVSQSRQLNTCYLFFEINMKIFNHNTPKVIERLNLKSDKKLCDTLC